MDEFVNFKRLCTLLFLTPICFTAFAADPDTEISSASETAFARNPYTKYYAFPFVNDWNYGYGIDGRTQDILDFKPIFSFQMSPSYDLILRTIAPLFYHQPNGTSTEKTVNGWGDLNPTAFISPAQYERTIWGAGPTFFMPTATNRTIGSGKWSMGPEVAVFTMPNAWVLGFLTSNVWSVAGDAKRQTVDQFSFQYFVSYNFPRGWFITSQPTITANWKAPGNQVWIVPVGLGGGKSFHFPDGGVTFSMQSFYNVIRPSQLGPNWTLQAKLEFQLVDRKVIPL